KAALKAALKANQPISEVDEEWLDNAGNLVDEERVVDELDKALDYERASIAGPAQPASTPADQQKYAQPVETHKKENATLEQRIEILNWHFADGENQTKIACHFDKIYPTLHLTQPRISAWIKHKAAWQVEYKNSVGSSFSVKRVHQTQHLEVMEILDLWVLKAMADKLLLTGKVLCQKWKAFDDLAGVPEDKRLGLSKGWLS
ncbi:hypothetical protein PAXRUDRAFT_158811, partial [Paxillus rubicundulus Ve08.2h10]